MSPPTRVVWIEITLLIATGLVGVGHHPHGWCGLKSLHLIKEWKCLRHHPHGWCGLKLSVIVEFSEYNSSPLTRVVWIEMMYKPKKPPRATGHHPHGWCGLKSHFLVSSLCAERVTTHKGGVD